MSTEEPFNVVLVGCGEQGWETAGPAIQSLETINVRLVALVDPDPKARDHASGLLGVERTYASLQQAFQAEERLDGAVIAAPNRFHETETRRALRLGLHVICEKPMAEVLAAARAMADAARVARKVLVIGYQYPWMHPGLLELRDDGRLDDVFSAKAEWRRFRGIPGSAHHWDKSSGGVGPDLIGHLLSVVRLGIRTAPLYVSAVGRNGFGHVLHGEAFHACDTVEAFIVFERARTAYVNVAWDTNTQLGRPDPNDPDRTIPATEEIGVEFDGLTVALEVPLIGRELDVERFAPRVSSRIGAEMQRGFLADPPPVQTEETSVHQARAWVRAARGIEPYPIPLENALVTQALLDAIASSVALGGKQVEVRR